LLRGVFTTCATNVVCRERIPSVPKRPEGVPVGTHFLLCTALRIKKSGASRISTSSRFTITYYFTQKSPNLSVEACVGVTYFLASSEYCRGVKKRAGGPQGSAACGGVKRPQRLGSRLPWRKQSEAGRLSGNPDSFSRPYTSSENQKTSRFLVRFFVLALPIFPASSEYCRGVKKRAGGTF